MPAHDHDPTDVGDLPVHALVAEASGTAVAEWEPCDGPRPGSVSLAFWFVRRKDGVPDVYAVASGDADDVTVELIPAEVGEYDAHAVVRRCLAGRDRDAAPDIECGVMHRGPLAVVAPVP